MSGTVGDNVARASGVIASAGGGGKIISQEYKGWDTISSVNPGAYGNFSDVGNASHSITPTAAGSSILISCIIVSGANSDGTFRIQGDIAGGGYNIIFQGASSGSRTRGTTTCNPPGNADITTLNGPWLWTPAYTLTDELTVKFQISGGNPGSRYLNRCYSPTDAAYAYTGYSSIVLQEIGA
jgi:hypothetical protein